MDQFETIRTLGHGAFGVATLVRQRKTGQRTPHPPPPQSVLSPISLLSPLFRSRPRRVALPPFHTPQLAPCDMSLAFGRRAPFSLLLGRESERVSSQQKQPVAASLPLGVTVGFLGPQRCARRAPLRVVKRVDLSRLSEGARSTAMAEVDVLRRLSHPHIVAYYDGFVEAETLHIVLEFADGGDLAAALRGRREREAPPYPDHEALNIFGQCMMALQCIHAKRIVHRDIKTQNVFLMENGDVKLGDFGISKVAGMHGSRCG